MKEDKSFQIPAWSVNKLNAIRWQRHPDNRANFGLKFPGRFGWVNELRVREAFRLFWQAYQQLDASRRHTTQSICVFADPVWELRQPFERQQIGRCFKFFAETGVLPISLVDSKWWPHKFVLVPFSGESLKAA